MKTHDKRQCGRAVAVYVEDGQGRRVILASDEIQGALRSVVVLAFTKQELRRAAAVLREMADELPDAPKEGAGQ